MARTMTDEQEREIRVYCEAANPAYIGKKLLAELDAERDAHNRTMSGWTSDHDRLCAKITALKARLALAEAVCKALDRYRDGHNIEDAYDALAAWRAGK